MATTTKTSESSGCQSESGNTLPETSTESSSIPSETDPQTSSTSLPSSLSPEEQDKFSWFVNGMEIGVCAVAHLLETEGRKDLKVKVLHLLDTREMANLTADMFWEMWMGWVKSGSAPRKIDFQQYTSKLDLV